MQSYFPPLKDHKPLFPWTNQITPKAEIPRYKNMTEDQFFDVIRTGQPFVIDDCATDWPYNDWPCKKFGESWPQGSMKAEYSDHQGHIKLGDGKWWGEIRKGDQQAQHMSKGKMVAGPYIWHVKDEEPEPVKQDVQKKWKARARCFPCSYFFVPVAPHVHTCTGALLYEQDTRQPLGGMGLVRVLVFAPPRWRFQPQRFLLRDDHFGPASWPQDVADDDVPGIKDRFRLV